MASRTKNSAKNIFTGVTGKLIVFLFAFLTRTAFARLLGTEYSGVDGLYSNILTVLALADLGIGSVFSYSLYQGLAEKDEKRTVELVATFRKIYLLIGAVILLIGLLLIPLLPLLVHSTLPEREVVRYYVLYLVNTAASYLFVYKATVLTADQKQYLSNICSTVFQIILYLSQLLYLMLTRDFTGYLIIQILCTVGVNFALTRIAEKQYPYLRNKNLPKALPLRESGLGSNVRATFLYKISQVVMNNTDNILISVLVGTVFVGKYAYYYLLLQYASAYIYLFATGTMASIGNLNTEGDGEKSYQVFETLNLLYASIAIILVCAYASCIQQFIPIWVGEEFYLDNACVVAMLLLFYLNTVSTPVWSYRESMGLFSEVRYIMAVSAVLNIVLSVVFGIKFGVAGILLATSLAKLSTHLWYEPLVLCRKMKRGAGKYFQTQGIYAAVMIGCVAGTYWLSRFFPVNLFGVVLRAASGMLIAGAVLWLCFHRTVAWKDLLERVGMILHREKGTEEDR